MGSNKTWQYWMVLTLISLLTVDNIIYSDNVLLANAYGNSLGQIKTKWQVGICLQPRGVDVFEKVEEGF